MAWVFNPFTGTLDQTGSGGGTPGGSNTQIQFNDGGSTFGGDADLTWNKTTNVMTVTGDVNLSDGGTYTTTLQTITPTANRTVSIPDATGTLALVAGSSGQLLWNNAGANAGASTLTYDGSILTTSGRFINSYNATASSPAKAFTGTWFTSGGTGTTTKPQVLIEPTGATSTAWSTSGTGLGVNAASGFAGNLLDLQVNGTSQARISSSGTINAALDIKAGRSITFAGACISYEAITTARFALNSDATQLWSEGSDIWAMRRSTNANTLRVYNTFTSTTNYERGYLSWASNVFRIGTEKGSGGGTARALEFQTDGTTRLTIDTSGGLLANAASGFAGNLLDLQVNGTSQLSVNKDGAIRCAAGSYPTNTNLFGVGTTGYGVYSGNCTLVAAGTQALWVSNNSVSIYTSSALQWAANGVSGADLVLTRDAANTFAQRNGTNAQTFRCYGTYTDASNYVRAALSSSSTAVTLAAETAGTGADNIPLNLTAAGTGTVKVNSVAEVVVSSTVAGLPAAPAVGMLTRVTDATAPAVGSTVAGGGAAAALVWYNGTNWTVIGV